ncbi:TolC family protein, partial [Pseudomonas aeruginosa]
MNRWGLGVLWLVAALPVAASVNPALSPDVPSMAREQGRSVLLSEQVIDLSLSDAVYLGLRNNRGIRSAYLQRIAQKFDLRVAADAFNPKLVVRGDYRANRATEDRTRTSNVSPTATLLGEYGTRFSLAWVKQFRTADEAGRYRSDGLDLTVVQPLLRDAGWDVTTAPLRLARLSEDANRLQLKASVSQTISQVIGAYRELLRAQEQARIAREALARTQELLEVNRAMIRAGRMAEFEIVQTEADVASQELNVEESTNQVDSARLALLQLLALDLSTQIRASDALAATPIEVDRQQAIRTALQQQPEYLQRLIGSRQADLNLVLAKNQRLWDV